MAESAVSAGIRDRDVLVRLDDVTITSSLTASDIVRGVSLTLRAGEVVGIVGESGSGKTLTCRAALGILPEPFVVSSGTVQLFGRDTAGLAPGDWTSLRGTMISAVFQDPGSYLNPSIRVGKQVEEVIRVKTGTSRSAARRRVVELFASVRLHEPEYVYQQYPHELSGGMLQRVAIAAAIALQPRVLIADEATTALDVTVQAEILDLLVELQEQIGLSLLVVSHDLAVVARLCDQVLVMKSGVVVEQGSTADILFDPQHPYTQLLIDEHHQFGLERFLDQGAHDHV